MARKDNTPSHRLSRTLAARVAILNVIVLLVSVFVAELLAWLILAPLLFAGLTVGFGLIAAQFALSIGVAGLVGGFLSIRLSRRFRHRLARLGAFAEAWLRGNLSLRIDDPEADELGILAEDLDLLAEHLEEDEQDLDRLRESNTRLTDQVRALAVVEERNRLARELHDSVKQHLFSLAMTASAIRTHLDLGESGESSNGELREMVREIEVAAQAAQRETTRLIEDLRPAPLQERGLAAALNDYGLLFGAREHVLVYVNAECSEQALPPAMTEALYRVAQEALHNVARHAQATRVDIILRCTDNRTRLTIEDNGVGFDTSRARKGLGITNMQERLLNAGGRLVIESRPGVGTTVTAEIESPAQAIVNVSAGQASASATLRQPLLPQARIRPPSNEIGPRGNRLAPSNEEPWFEPTLPAPTVGVPTDPEFATSVHSPVPLPTSPAEPKSEGTSSGEAPLAARPADISRSAEAWSWLGQKLVIPVGQQWPWPPDEVERHLHRPLVEVGTLTLRREHRLFGLTTSYALSSHDPHAPIIRIFQWPWGHAWVYANADWRVRHLGGLHGRALLVRNGQPLAAMQYWGHQADTWTEILYGDHAFYYVHDAEDASGGFVFTDDGNQPLMAVVGAEVRLYRELPLPLVAMVVARVIDEISIRREVQSAR